MRTPTPCLAVSRRCSGGGFFENCAATLPSRVLSLPLFVKTAPLSCGAAGGSTCDCRVRAPPEEITCR